MSLSMILGFTLHDGTLTALRHGEARHWCPRDMWCLPQAGMVGVGGMTNTWGRTKGFWEVLLLA